MVILTSLFLQCINKKIIFAELEEGKWQKKYEEEKNHPKKLFFKSLVKLARLKADYFRLVSNQQPETEEVQSIVEEEIQNSTLRTFERFKQWAKKTYLDFLWLLYPLRVSLQQS